MDDGDIGPDRRHRRQHLPGIGAGHGFDLGIDLGQIGAEIAAEGGEGQVCGPRLIGIGHGGMGMLLDGQGPRPAVLDGVAHAVERAHPGIAAPGEDQLLRRPHADELVIDDVRRHAHQSEAAALLADQLMPGGIRDQMGEALQGDDIAVADIGRDGLGKRNERRHRPGSPRRRDMALAHRRPAHQAPRTRQERVVSWSHRNSLG